MTLIATTVEANLGQHARRDAVVSALGLRLDRLPTGGGLDAMKLHDVMPQAMLFVRGGNGGISLNPLESVTVEDAALAVRAMTQLLSTI